MLASGRAACALAVTLACVLAGAVVASEGEDWRPLSLVVALAALMVAADAIVVWARRVRMSAGLTVHVTIMALLGPAPAVAIGILSTLVDALVNRVRPWTAFNNVVILAGLGLAGGVMFDSLGAALDLDHDDARYALLVVPVFAAVLGLNLVLVVAASPELVGMDRLPVLRATSLATVPWELVNCASATAAVLAWAEFGLPAVAGLLVLLVITIPLLRTLAAAIKRGDDLVVLRSEMLGAEERERARLAESLHDGPMQRLVAIRQDVAEAGAAVPVEMCDRLDAAIAETRAIITAFHPATVRELGLEASLRAAAVPFPAARSVELTVRSAIDDRLLAGTQLPAIARELVVNALKHGRPSAIDVSVVADGGRLVLDVRDDGDGVDACEIERAVQAGHSGLAIVRRRVEGVGGLLDIAANGSGTRARAIVPLER